MFDEPVYALRVDRIQATQVHPVPDKILNPRGPFPEDLFDEPEIIVSLPEDEFVPGATAQNNFRPPKYLRCSLCHEKVLEAETLNHRCGE